MELPAPASDLRPIATGRDYQVEGVLFDFDGTLTKQGAIDFEGMRKAIGAPEGIFILEYMEGLSAGDREAAEQIVVAQEIEAAARAEPNEGAEEAVAAVRAAGLPVGVITRNRRASVEHSLERFPSLRIDAFDIVVTREDGFPFKPAPDSLLHAATVLGVAAARTMMVGDFIVDVQAGAAAGAITVYLYDAANHGFHPPQADVVLNSLKEFPAALTRGLPE